MATPGREPAAADEQVDSFAAGGFVSPVAGAAVPRAQRYIAALGGASNLSVVDACTTRLRLSVVDSNKVSESELKTIGARGVLKRGSTNVQVIIGPEADIIADEMRTVIAQGGGDAVKPAAAAAAAVGCRRRAAGCGCRCGRARRSARSRIRCAGSPCSAARATWCRWMRWRRRVCVSSCAIRRRSIVSVWRRSNGVGLGRHVPYRRRRGGAALRRKQLATRMTQSGGANAVAGVTPALRQAHRADSRSAMWRPEPPQ